MDNGNGKLNPEAGQEKTPEQLMSERLARYQANPERFIEISDIIFASLRNPKSALGITMVMGECRRAELDISFAELQYKIHQIVLRRSIDAEMQKAHKIQQPHGILNGARKMFGRK